jgi:hypothetical protein
MVGAAVVVEAASRFHSASPPRWIGLRSPTRGRSSGSADSHLGESPAPSPDAGEKGQVAMMRLHFFDAVNLAE